MRVRLLTLLISVVSTSVRAQTLWPKNTNGNVTIPYYFDNNTIPIGDPRRSTFHKAVELYKKSTCIQWVEVARNETPGYVKVQGHASKCSSYTGRIVSGTNNISLATRCNVLGTILHEMAHALGMEHTHQRPDRNTYVEIWKDNINNKHLKNFDIRSSFKTQGIPYDYLSIMHYSSMHFSGNKLYTMTPKNRMAVFAMGVKGSDFRWSDAAWINKAYKCESFFLKTCQPLNCTNGGYVGKDCSCKCPENTKGTLCEMITGDLFDIKPGCGGIVRTERNISANAVTECVYQIIAPRCKIPQINVTKAWFVTKSCTYNRLILHVEKSSFGHAYCNTSDIPFRKGFTSDSSEAVVYYYAAIGAHTNSWFTASIKFLKNTTWPGVVHTAQTTAAYNGAVTLEGPCGLIESLNSSYIYSTPNFPSPVACYAECSADFNTAQSTSLVIYEVNVDPQIRIGEKIYLQDSYLIHKVLSNNTKTVLLLWPFKLKFIGSDHPGNGFRITLTPAKIVVRPCGEVLKLLLNETKTITNPLMSTTNTIKSCSFKIEAEGDHGIDCSVTNLGNTALAINMNYPKQLQFTRAAEKTYKSVENSIDIYYYLRTSKTDWSIACKAVLRNQVPPYRGG